MSAPPGTFRIVFTTADSDELARRLALELVGRRLAACVNIVGPVRSVYRFKGRIVDETERLLLIKTTAARFDELRRAIREIHTYDVPEVLAVRVEDGDAPYLDWLSGCVKPEG